MENKQNVIKKNEKVHRTCKVVYISKIQIPKHFLKIKKYVKKFEINNWEMDQIDLEKFNISKLTPKGYRVTLWKNLIIPKSDTTDYTEEDIKLLAFLKYNFPEYAFRLVENNKNSGNLKTSLLIDGQHLIIDWVTYPDPPEYLKDHKEINYYDIVKHEVAIFIKKYC